MARLQILQLPEGASDDRPPFVLVVDQADDAFRHELGDPNATMRDAQADLAKALGASAVLVFRQSVEIPANDVLPLPLLSTDTLDDDAVDPGLADLVFRTLGIELAPGGIPYDEALHNACRQLEKSEAGRRHLNGERVRLKASLERVRNAPDEPEIMNAQEEHPAVWKHGYGCGVRAVKSAARQRNETTVKP